MPDETPLLGCFISIPKCASKTILSMFQLGQNRTNHYSEKSEQCIIYEDHQRLKILEKKFDLNNIYTFAFVRHPYSRIKSWYYYHKKIKPYNKQSLDEWIRNGCQTHWELADKGENQWNKEKISPLLQYNFIQGNKKVNYIGKLENFDEDCKKIISNLNEIFKKNNYQKKINFKYIKKNITTGKEYPRCVISEKSKNLIYTMFKKDFDYFNYEK